MSEHQNLTIMFTDVVGFTRLTSNMTRADMRRLMQVHDETVLPIIDAYGGRRIKSMGDAFLLTFRSPTDAVLCGMAVQDAVAAARAANPHAADLQVRVAISSGDVRLERNDIFGEAVNIAARLESLTPPNAVYFAESVYLAMAKADVAAQAIGTKTLKGIPHPVKIYAASPVADAEAQPDALPFGGTHTQRTARPSLAHRARAIARSAWLTRSANFGRQVLVGGAAAAGAGAAAVALTVVISSIVGGELTPPIGDVGAAHQATTEYGLRPGQNAGAEAVHASVDAAGGVSPANWLVTGLASLDRGDGAAFDAYVDAGMAREATRAHATMLRGYARAASGQIKRALGDFAAAVEAEETLANDARLAGQLVAQLSQYTADIERFIRAHPSEALLEALAKRSGEEGFFGRHHAVRILQDLGHDERVRWFDYAVEEIRGRSACEDRLAAVNILGELGDPKAIPYLREARGSGVGAWLENRCLRGVAKTWIEQLEAQG